MKTCGTLPGHADRLAALLAALLSGLVYVYCMAPGVTLGDSGELVTAAYTFGVPHPTGYPLWTLAGFLWSHFILPWGNPAWRIAMLSGVAGATLVGVLALTLIRGMRVLLAALPWSASVTEPLQHRIALASGFSAALLSGFSRAVWHWACVAELQALGTLVFTLMMAAFLAWAIRPCRYGFLYAAVLLLGASFNVYRTTAAMTIVIMAGTLVIGMESMGGTPGGTPRQGGRLRVLMPSLGPFAEVGVAGLLSYLVVRLVLWRLQSPTAGVWDYDTWDYPGTALGGGVVALGLLAVGWRSGCWKPGRALACAGCFLAGLALYLYLPLAASTNPPMNWGYTATRTGFLHVVQGGSYAHFASVDVFTREFGIGLWRVVQSLIEQYSLPLVLISLVPWFVMSFGWKRLTRSGRLILALLGLATVSMGLEFTMTVYRMPASYIEEALVRYSAPVHLLGVVHISMGMAILLSLASAIWPRVAMTAVPSICAVLLALPLITFTRNGPACNRHRDDFGYRFGHLLFDPGGDYPPMETNAILFAGTDAARFVSTYMVFCESRVAPQDRFRDSRFDRSDVSILAQNAFADNTYMSSVRDQYDVSRPRNDSPLQRRLGRDRAYPPGPIHLPGPEEAENAFQRYVEDLRLDRFSGGGRTKRIQGAVLPVQGTFGVMAINGILAQWIFDRNKGRHAFYVVESYRIPWMYPHLRPAGVVLKLEEKPLPTPPEEPSLWREIVARDRAYWDRLTAEFLARADFQRNDDGRQCFAKLRAAIAGLYAFRGLAADAEYAFKQALQLCPRSAEASFRLADLYVGQRRHVEARRVMEACQALDPDNDRAGDFITAIQAAEKDDSRREELENQGGAGTNALNSELALELAALYQRRAMDAEFEQLVRSLMAGTNLPPRAYLTLAKLCQSASQWELQTLALRRWLQQDATDYRSWIELAFAEWVQDKPDAAMTAFERAVEVGGNEARRLVRFDPRRQSLMDHPGFQALVDAR